MLPEKIVEHTRVRTRPQTFANVCKRVCRSPNRDRDQCVAMEYEQPCTLRYILTEFPLFSNLPVPGLLITSVLANIMNGKYPKRS